MRVQVPLEKAYRLINHGPATLVTSKADGRANVMAAAWVSPLDSALVSAVISNDSLTRELIERSGEFALSLPTVGLVDAVYRSGSLSGRDGDKFAAAGLATFPASKVAAPLIEGCVGWLECRLRDESRAREKYDLLIADVVAAWADVTVYRDGQWRFEGQPDKRTLHHVSKGVFLASGEVVEASTD